MTPPHQPARLRVAGLALGHGDVTLVRDLEFDVAAGEIVAVLAPSGRGKTTLLRTIVRLADPQAGTIELDGTPIEHVAGPSLRRRIALVAQRPVLLGPTVADDLASGLGHAPSASERRGLLEEVGLPEAFAGHDVEGCSGGEQARVAIARALATDPAVLLLDEPSAALDQAATRSLAGALRARAARGLAILLVTHDPLLLSETGARTIEFPTSAAMS